jgi:hypothetical protein
MKKNGTTTERRDELIARHKDNLMGIPVVLLNAAHTEMHGEETGVVVPDVRALEAAIAVARTTVAYKLSGDEVRFLRRAINEKSATLAKFLDMTPEHFSRLENGGALTTNAERVFRLRVMHQLRDKARGVKVKDDDILNMTFIPVRPSPEAVTLVFERLYVLDDLKHQVWHFVGVDKSQEAGRTLRIVA